MKNVLAAFFALIAFLSSQAQEKQFYFTTSDSTRLYVRISGKGKPCLFVHGEPGSTSYYFEAMRSAPIIEKGLQMIYFDQRGSGRSDSATSGDYSMERMILDMEEIRKHLAIPKWALMGHSFGGLLLTNYALAHQRVLSGLFYINATNHMQASMLSHLEFGLEQLNLGGQKEFADTTVPLQERVWKVHAILTEKDIWYKLMYRNAWEKRYNDSVTLSAGRFNRAFANACWNVPSYWKDYTPLTAKIKCPVLVMTGDEDYAIGRNHYKSFQFPNKTVVHYIGGHAPFQEEPQWFAEKILSYVPKLH